MRLINSALLFILVALAVQPVVARAQDNDARSLSRSGIEHFRRGEYAAAIEDFETSYAFRPLAELRFNIAQAHRSLGHCKEALREYRRYLQEAPQGRVSPQAAAGADEMERCILRLVDSSAESSEPETADQAHVAEPAKPVAPAVTSAPAAVNSATSFSLRAPLPTRLASGDAGRRKKLAGLILGGVGAGSLALGAIFLGTAKQASDQISNDPVFSPAVEDRLRVYSTLEVVFLSVGGAAVVAGTATYLIGRREARRTF